MSVFASKAPLPQCNMCLMTVSRVSHCTAQCSLGMLSLTDEPFGHDKSCIRWNDPGSFLGINPMGDTMRFGSGGLGKGPATRPAANSCCSLMSTI